MTKTEQRIAIAEALGAEWVNHPDFNGVPGWGWQFPDTYHTQDYYNSERVEGAKHLPDYLNDLNAMREAERTLTPEQRKVYMTELLDSCGFSYDDTMSDEEANFECRCMWAFAAAEQRAEAFLKTLKLWKD